MNRAAILNQYQVDTDTKFKVETIVLDCLDKAQKKFGSAISMIPEIKFDTISRCAGIASWNEFTGKYSININPVLLKTNPDHILNVTVPHEIAHIVVCLLFKGCSFMPQPHGKEWASIMKLFGLEPNRTHSLDVSEISKLNNKKMYQYKCNCTTRNLSQNKHTRSINGTAYICSRCKTPIRFTGVVINNP